MTLDRRTLSGASQAERKAIIKQRMYKFILQWFKTFHIAPTLREIGDAVGINSTSVINYHLHEMAEEGLIDKEPSIPGMKGISRGIKVVDAVWLSPDEAREYQIMQEQITLLEQDEKETNDNYR